MTSKVFYDMQDPDEALKAFLNAHDTLDDRMREESLKLFMGKFLPSVEGKQVLDIGAGGGIWTRFWLDAGARVTALDRHGPILQGNKKRNPGAEFVEADAVTAKLKREFDVIYAKDLIEHIPDDAGFFENMRDHLKPSGHLVLTTQNSLSLNYLIEGGYHFLRGHKGWLGYDPTHVRFYSPKSLSAKLKDAGLKPVRYWSSYHFPYRFLSRLLLRKLVEWKGFHLVELLRLNWCFPFSLTGWNLGVIAMRDAG